MSDFGNNFLFNNDPDEPVGISTSYDQNEGEGSISVGGEEDTIEIIDRNIGASTCQCPMPGQFVAGPTQLQGQGGDSNNTFVGNLFINDAANALTRLVNQQLRPPILISAGNGNQFKNLSINANDQAGVKVQAGNNNSISGLHIEQLDPAIPIMINPGANGDEPAPNVIVKRATANFFGLARITGSVNGPPNADIRIDLYAADFNALSATAETPLGLSFVVTTDASGMAVIDQMFSEVSSKLIFHQNEITATGTVLSGPGERTTVTEGNTSQMSAPAAVPRSQFDLDGDGLTDIAVYRPGPSAASPSYWYSQNSIDNGFRAVQFGLGEDKVAAADYHGSLLMNFGVWRPSNGTWYFSGLTGDPSTNFGSFPFGLSTDVPVIGDFDGDRRNDPAVFRGGDWWIRESLTQMPRFQHFGLATDKPVPADYNGDGRTDIAVYRDGVWFIRPCATCAVRVEYFGLASDVPVPGDYDGDGKDDIAVFRPSTGTWYVNGSTIGFTAFQWGLNGDMPLSGDFDGDGKADVGVFRPSDGNWYIRRSLTGSPLAVHWGQNGDIPVPSFRARFH
jgi:hypothetical protein